MKLERSTFSPAGILLAIGFALMPMQQASAALLAGNELTASASNTYSSDFSYGFTNQQANDFSLGTPAYVETISWWGLYTGDGSTLTDNFTIRILPDNGSGAPVADQTMAIQEFSGITVSRVDSGFRYTPGSVPIYEYTFALPSSLLLSADTYYLSVVNNTPDSTDHWAWAANSTSGTRWNRSAEGGSWNTTTSELTFQIEGTSVPEPGSMILLGTVGAFGLCTRLRRRRKTQEPE